MDAVIGIFILILILTPFVLIIVWAVRYQRRMIVLAWEKCQEAFRRNGIRITSVLPEKRNVLLSLRGEFRSGSINVWQEYRGTGKSRQLYTLIRIELGISLSRFSLSRENIFTRIGEGIGMKDVKTGDNDFDKAFRLHMNETEVSKVFTSTVIAHLLSVKKDFWGNIESKGNEILISHAGSPGYKIGTRQFNALFDTAFLIISFLRPSSAGHSPML